MKKKNNNLAPFVFLLVFIVMCMILVNMKGAVVNEITIDEFTQYLDNSEITDLEIITNLEKLNKLTYEEKILYQKSLSSLKINEYIIETKQDINNYKTLNYQLRTTLEDYEIFIIIIILLISTTILSEEISKGSIKLLLIKPYSRTQIFISKYLTIIIMLITSIFVLYLTEVIIGGLFLGFNNLSEKVVIYNYQKSQIICYNIFVYTLIRVIAKLPMLILISSLAYMLSIITNSKSLSLTISILIYMFNQSINSLAIIYNLKIMKYILLTNWNFEQYLFGSIPPFKYINIKYSILICIIYYLIINLISLNIFKNKDIKNI